jgi:ankyrin repeat protein
MSDLWSFVTNSEKPFEPDIISTLEEFLNPQSVEDKARLFNYRKDFKVADHFFPSLTALHVGSLGIIPATVFQCLVKVAQAAGLSLEDPAGGLPPLILASVVGQYVSTHVLLKAGANPNVAITPRYEGKAPDHFPKGSVTPLLAAIESHSYQCVAALLSHGANPNLTHRADGVTPLMLAARHGCQGIVTRLLSAGADAAAVDAVGLTAFHHAQTEEIAQLFSGATAAPGASS